MLLTYLMLAVALMLSAVAAFYSIIGLTAIFAAAVWPIVIMGTILEAAKLTVTVWLHEYWSQVKVSMKLYLVFAVFMLMVITSMGIFGFLSKAHLDQVVPTGDVQAQVGLIDEKITNERDTIANARTLLGQLDRAVTDISNTADQEIKLRDGTTQIRSSAERALQVRRQQAQDRAALTKTIEQSQTRIVTLQAEKAPFAKDLRAIEAEVGPVKYIAALIYGDNPDANLLEKAVRWVIMILVVVFDPLAIMMLLAATESYRWERQRRVTATAAAAKPMASEPRPPTMEPAPPVAPPSPIGIDLAPEPAQSVPYHILDDDSQSDYQDPSVPASAVPSTSLEDDNDQDLTVRKSDLLPAETNTAEPPHEQQSDINDTDDADDDPDSSSLASQCKRLWKQDHPGLTLKEQRRLVAAGRLDYEPWLDYVDDPRIQRLMQHGDELPATAHKGDMFMLVSVVPTQLYKHNGMRWIPTDKNLTDQYAHDSDYIEFLINRIGDGSYDPDLLTEAERAKISQQLAREF